MQITRSYKGKLPDVHLPILALVLLAVVARL